MAGHAADAEKILAELTEWFRKRYVSPLVFSSIDQDPGRRDEYFFWSEEAFQERANGLLSLKLSLTAEPLDERRPVLSRPAAPHE